MKLKTLRGRCFLAFLVVFIGLFSSVIHAFAYIPCRCGNPPDECTCFIQLGDKGLPVEGIISALKSKGYLKDNNIKKTFTPEVKQAVIQFQTEHNLECTGWMDDETLDALLFDVLPDESIQQTAEFWDAICFVPTDGGKKHHSDPTCSGMKNPRMISRVNAMKLGIEPCGKDGCKKCTPLTYTALGLQPRTLPDSYYIAEEQYNSRRNLSEDVESLYIANKKSHIFHKATCNFVTSMSEKNKVEFSSRDEAIENGYRPCSKCNP